jgi:Mn2+/Fe2+ NRAMP family transporter
MSYQTRINPEIWLAAITAVVFFPMMYMLNQQRNFDLWRFSLLFTMIISMIYLYA